MHSMIRDTNDIGMYHVREHESTRTMSMKRDIGGIEMSV